MDGLYLLHYRSFNGYATVHISENLDECKAMLLAYAKRLHPDCIIGNDGHIACLEKDLAGFMFITRYNSESVKLQLEGIIEDLAFFREYDASPEAYKNYDVKDAQS